MRALPAQIERIFLQVPGWDELLSDFDWFVDHVLGKMKCEPLALSITSGEGPR